MADLGRVIAEVADALRVAGIDYMIIGGVANVVWGSTRSTVDLDITVAATADDIDRVERAFGEQIAHLPADAKGFARDTGVIPFVHRSGIRVELILGTHDYARTAIDRAVDVEIAGVAVRVCTPEDLLLHKIVSERDRDRNDVADLIVRRGETLDRSYLDPRVHELATLLERPGIEVRYRELIDRP